jgi:hypothetical protein
MNAAARTSRHPERGVIATGMTARGELAHRARLPGAQAGSGARSLRRTRLARIPPSRQHVHRSLRLPDLREGRHSPLGRAPRNPPPATCPSRGLQTPRRRRCGLSGTFPTPSPACDAVSSPASREHCHDVPVVPLQAQAEEDGGIRDAVRLTRASRVSCGTSSLGAWAAQG